MQLIKLATFPALVMTVSGTVHSVLTHRGESDDSVELVARGAGSCSNKFPIRQGNTHSGYMKGGCVFENSKGTLSSHNCANKGGKAYLCVQGETVTCISGKDNVKKANLEGGECFL